MREYLCIMAMRRIDRVHEFLEKNRRPRTSTGGTRASCALWISKPLSEVGRFCRWRVRDIKASNVSLSSENLPLSRFILCLGFFNMGSETGGLRGSQSQSLRRDWRLRGVDINHFPCCCSSWVALILAKQRQ